MESICEEVEQRELGRGEGDLSSTPLLEVLGCRTFSPIFARHRD